MILHVFGIFQLVQYQFDIILGGSYKVYSLQVEHLLPLVSDSLDQIYVVLKEFRLREDDRDHPDSLEVQDQSLHP